MNDIGVEALLLWLESEITLVESDPDSGPDMLWSHIRADVTS